jgi:ferritin-like metal-binding protein YciE
MKQNQKSKNQNVQSRMSSKSANSSKESNGQKGQESLLEKFFTDQLKDIYYAEQKLLKAIPKMAQASTTEELEDAFNDHLKQTEKHVKRLEKVFQMLGKKPEAKKCEAIEGIVKEAETIINETKKESMTRDAALIIAAQKVEHYEIATYGGLVQLALTMDLHRAADILDKTLMEEEDTDRLLTEVAENYINIRAEEEGNQIWQKEEKGEEFETSNSTSAYSM